MKGNNDIKTLAHSTYRCQYHIVFAPKYRRQIIYGKIKKDVGEILRKLCEQKKVEIIEAEACKDHIHLLVSIPPYLSVAQFMGYLKGKSSLRQHRTPELCGIASMPRLQGASQ
jgi:putative transposase